MRIYEMKYSWTGHKNTNRHKSRIKRSGQTRLVYVVDVNRNAQTQYNTVKLSQRRSNMAVPMHRDMAREKAVNSKGHDNRHKSHLLFLSPDMTVVVVAAFSSCAGILGECSTNSFRACAFFFFFFLKWRLARAH